MSNLSYRRSADRERAIKHTFEKQGWIAIRSAGSHGFMDVTLIRPAPSICADPNHYEVRFIQVKTSYDAREQGQAYKVADTPAGLINYEEWTYPSRRMRTKK